MTIETIGQLEPAATWQNTFVVATGIVIGSIVVIGVIANVLVSLYNMSTLKDIKEYLEEER